MRAIEAQVSARRLDESASGAIRLLWSERFGHGSPSEYVAPPDGLVDVVAAERRGHVTIHVVGTAFPAAPKPTLGMTSVAVARLHAGAVPALFGVPARDFAGRAVALSDVIPEGASLVDRVANAVPERRAVVLTEALSASDYVSSPPLTAIERLHFDGDVTVDQIATRIGFSTRTLRRIFDDAVGVSPRTYLALVRLNRAVDYLKHASSDTEGAARIAVAAGYCDQSHMIRDFKRFMGDTPNALAALWRARPPVFRPGFSGR